ncbi:MAG: DUF262 domain-containing protein [Ignavibacteria bacterium]|nr:DUF262 domain-containing protein [Ignavibacteria bacterium]
MATNNLQPTKLISLLELFEGKKFEVPDYQRGYSWDEEQILDLLTDIEMHNSKSGHKHFTGTIVVERPNGGDVYQIVDGQQRLVTCVMILRAIVEIDPTKLPKIESILKKTPSGYETALRLSDYDNDFFEGNILNQKYLPIVTSSNKRLSICYSTITDWLRREGRDTEKMFECLKSQLGFIFFETSSARETTTMFEVINNRGKALSDLEKFKNYFIHLCNLYDFMDLSNKISSAWGEILSHLEDASLTTTSLENRFVRNSFGVIFWWSWKEKDDLYKSVRSHFSDKEKTNSSENQSALEKTLTGYFEFFLSAAKTYALIFCTDRTKRKNSEQEITEDLEVIFKNFRNHGSSDNVIPLLLVLMDNYFKYPKIRSTIAETIKIVEVLNFRVYCLPRIFFRTDTKRSFMYAMAYNTYYGYSFNEKLEFVDEINEKNKYSKEYYHKIQEKLIRFIEKYCPERKFVQALTLDSGEIENYYGWASLNFFLAKYEQHLHKNDPKWDFETLLMMDGKNKLTKEHFLAIENEEVFGGRDSIEKRRLGNMMLVPSSINSSLSKKAPWEKIMQIRDNINLRKNLYQLDEVVKLYLDIEKDILSKNKNTLNRRREILQRVLDSRETNMIKFALEEWKYPGEPNFRFQKVNTLQAQKEKRNSRYYPDYERGK